MVESPQRQVPYRKKDTRSRSRGDFHPKPFTLLGENVALFADEAGNPAALADRRCHRTAKLSKGLVRQRLHRVRLSRLGIRPHRQFVNLPADYSGPLSPSPSRTRVDRRRKYNDK